MDFDKLNKNYTYSFVMQHEDCKNISHVNEKMLILVEVYDRFNYKSINNNLLLPDENNYNGYTFSLSNKLSLKNKINKFLNLSFKRKQKMSKNSRFLATQKFDEKLVINKYLEIIA